MIIKVHWEKCTSAPFTAKTVGFILYTLIFILHFHWKSHSLTDLCWHLEDACGEARSWKDRTGKLMWAKINGENSVLWHLKKMQMSLSFRWDAFFFFFFGIFKQNHPENHEDNYLYSWVFF